MPVKNGYRVIKVLGIIFVFTEDRSRGRIFTVTVVSQIKTVIAGRLNYRIVNICIIDPDPCINIRVIALQLLKIHRTCVNICCCIRRIGRFCIRAFFR